MVLSLFSFIFAVLGLGFLIFIHELGHYWMARRSGMRVESFGIGFGRPIYSFQKDGVTWNICWLPFGGYVKIAGMEQEKDGREPQDIEDGFFGKSPLARIKVSLMGPLANLALAFLIFSILWLTGGREKNFSDVTKKVGWVDPKSELYKQGLRPGDEILSYNNEPVRSAKDHFQAAMTASDKLKVEARRYNRQKKAYENVVFSVRPYPHPLTLEQGIMTTGVLAPASYLLYMPEQNGQTNMLPQGSPLIGSGLEACDRIIAIDGEQVFSLQQLSAILNDHRALLTIERDGKLLQKRVLRMAVDELKLGLQEREELTDWQWEAGLKVDKLSSLLFIPYNVNAECVVENKLDCIDQEKEQSAFPQVLFSAQEEPLAAGDRIVAVDGIEISRAYELLKNLQTKKVSVIVQKKPAPALVSWKEADSAFDHSFSKEDLEVLVQNIGKKDGVKEVGTLCLLKPVEPKTRLELIQMQDRKAQFEAELEEERKNIEAIDNPEKRAYALKYLEKQQKQLLLGLPGVQDVHVTYNPNPFVLFGEIADEVGTTLSALVGGYLNPKWLSGPIGIVQVIHQHWMLGIKEALFWLGIISLNLGLLNLLPLPVLDGGYIALSCFEILTGKRLKSKTIEKIIVPFAILLIGFLVFLTYHDILRLLSNLFKL